jgi:hypothetical protein
VVVRLIAVHIQLQSAKAHRATTEWFVVVDGMILIGLVIAERASWGLSCSLVEDGQHDEIHCRHIQCCIWRIGDNKAVPDRSESLMPDMRHRTDVLWESE